MSRILTLTLNPAIDQTIVLDALVPGSVQRASAVRSHAGGKGVNVASCLADWGLNVAATGILGADNAAPFDQLFARKGIADRFLRIPGETRTNPENRRGSGIEGGATRKVGKGDIFLVPQDTPHWFSAIDGRLVMMSVHVPRR